MPALTETDTPTCDITNNSGIDVVVATPYVATESKTPNSIMSYDQTLEVLPVSTGGTVIPAGKQATVTLNQTTGANVLQSQYDLIISGASNYLPILNKPVVDFGRGFKPVVVASTDKDAASQTQSFMQTMAALPNSALIKNYVAAANASIAKMKSAADGSSGSTNAVNDISAAGLSDFFKSTESYKLVTADHLHVMNTYYDRFPIAWANGESKISYYLYANDSTTTTFAGVMSFSVEGGFDITKINAGYDITFSPAVDGTDRSNVNVDDSKSVKLSYVKGTFVNDTKTDLPDIALRGGFQVKRTFTRLSTDNKIIIIMAGSIYGSSAIGFDESQIKTSEDGTQAWLDGLFHPKTGVQIYQAVMQFMGMIMALFFVGNLLWTIGKAIRSSLSNNKPMSRTELEDLLKDIAKQQKESQQPELDKISQKKSRLPEDADDALSEADSDSIGDIIDLSKTQDQQLLLEEEVENMAGFEDELPELENTLNDLVSGLKDVQGVLDKIGNGGSLKDLAPELQTKFKALTQNFNEAYSDLATKLSDSRQAEVAESKAKIEEMSTQQEEQEKTNTEEEEDINSEEPNIEEFPMDF